VRTEPAFGDTSKPRWLSSSVEQTRLVALDPLPVFPRCLIEPLQSFELGVIWLAAVGIERRRDLECSVAHSYFGLPLGDQRRIASRRQAIKLLLHLNQGGTTRPARSRSQATLQASRLIRRGRARSMY
jgi:hypothetical protein